jgi:hypothetical protein
MTGVRSHVCVPLRHSSSVAQALKHRLMRKEIKSELIRQLLGPIPQNEVILQSQRTCPLARTIHPAGAGRGINGVRKGGDLGNILSQGQKMA